MRKIISFSCPCCHKNINAIKVMNPGVNNGCKTLKDKKCFYCPHCDNKIGKEHSSRLNLSVQFGLITGIYFVINILNSYFDIPFYIDLLLWVIFFYSFLILFIHMYPFTCYSKEDAEIERDNWDGFYEPHDGIRADGFEKNVVSTLNFIPMLFVLIAFAVLIFVVFL